MKNILWLMLAHFILDYPLQGEFLAKTKGSNWYSLLAHSIIYGLGMAFVFDMIGVYALWKVAVLCFSHALIDYKKATAIDKTIALTTYLYIDQALHIAINFILYAV